MSNGAQIFNEQSGIVVVANGPTAISGDGEFINWGEVEEQASSQLSFNVRVTSNEGSFVADDNITFNAPAAFNGGAPANGQNANLAGTGRILFSSNFWVDGDTTSDVTTLDLNGSANVDAAFTVDGDVAFNGGTSISGILTLNGSTCNFNAPVTISGESSGVTVSAAASLKIAADLSISAGSLTNNSVAGSSWTGGAISLSANAKVLNTGTFTITATNGTITGNGEFINARSPMPGDELLFIIPTANVNVLGSATIAVTFKNSTNGLLDLMNGTLIIDHAWTQLAGATTLFSGGNLQVNGDFTNSGLVSVGKTGQIAVDTYTNDNQFIFVRSDPQAPLTPNTLTVTSRPNVAGGGNFTQGANGTLLMEITGNSGNDALAVNGTATLGGTLTVTIPDGVGVNTNWSWTMITSNLRMGLFATVTQPPGYYMFSEPTYSATSVSVQNPDIVLPGAQATNENVALVLSGANNNAISIPDPDAGSALLQIALAVTNGTLTLSGTSGLTFSSGTGTGDTSMTFVGTISDINAALAGLVYQPNTYYYGSDSLTITTADTPDSGGSYSENDTVPINVTWVNQAPIGTDKTVTTLANTPYVFATSDFGFTDPNDAPANNFKAVEITTLPTLGTLTDNGVAVAAGDFVSVADITASKLVYTTPSDTPGTPHDSLAFQVQDDGGTDNGGIDTDPTPRTMNINRFDTTTTETGPTDLIPVGQDVVVTATVVGVAPAVGTPTGTVNFYEGTTLLAAARLMPRGPPPSR